MILVIYIYYYYIKYILTNFNWKLVITLSYLWLMFGTYLLNICFFLKRGSIVSKFQHMNNKYAKYILCSAFVIITFDGFQFSTIFLNINKNSFTLDLLQIILCQTSIEGILIYGITKKPITIKPTQWYGIYSKIFGLWIFVMKYSIIRG